eukprot:768127-Hanusia_phi.AAC.3
MEQRLETEGGDRVGLRHVVGDGVDVVDARRDFIPGGVEDDPAIAVDVDDLDGKCDALALLEDPGKRRRLWRGQGEAGRKEGAYSSQLACCRGKQHELLVCDLPEGHAGELG